MARGRADVSAILDLSPHRAPRDGRVASPIANTNLIVAKTLLPQLSGEISVGTTVLAMAAMALTAGEAATAALPRPPAAPDLQALEADFAAAGRPVTAFLPATRAAVPPIP